MLLKTIVLAAALALGGGAFAATAATPPGTADNPHPDSPTSLLRAAKQGGDASAGSNTGPAASGPVTADTGGTAGTGKAGKQAAKKSRKRHATKPAA